MYRQRLLSFSLKSHKMLKDKSIWFWLIFIFVFCIFLTVFNLKYNLPRFLTFSDAAKFADIARNLVNGRGFTASFSFFGPSIFSSINTGFYSARGIPVFTPFIISMFYRLVGVTDLAVIITSLIFFVLTMLFSFLLAKSIFKNNLVALLSTLAIGTNYDLINYAASGASESPFIFEILSTLYFISLRKRWASVVAVLILIAMYLTRPQSFIYIAGAILFWLLINYKTKKAFIWFGILSFLAVIVDKLLIPILPQNIFLISIFARGQNSLSQYLPSVSVSNALRGGSMSASVLAIAKKVFYNLYNFYKLLPQILNPYLFLLFVIGVFRWSKNKTETAFKISALFMIVVTVGVTAISIPFYRYIHPVAPLIYLMAIETLVWIVGLITKNRSIPLIATILVLCLVVGQTVGIIFLDSRFNSNRFNLKSPPAYVKLAWILKDNTASDQKVLTNLDTWASWYGERSSVWFPIEPKQIINPSTGTIPFDVIYLTDYLIDDPNYDMGDDWHQIFDNPSDPKKWKCESCQEIAKEFKFKNSYKVVWNDDYEKSDFKSILLVKK